MRYIFNRREIFLSLKSRLTRKNRLTYKLEKVICAASLFQEKLFFSGSFRLIKIDTFYKMLVRWPRG